MQLTPQLHLLKHGFEISLTPTQKIQRFVYSLIIFGETITLVDSGVKGCDKTISEYIEKQGRSVNEISLLILSHSHPDHIGSAQRLKTVSNCTVAAHEAEKNWIENLHEQVKARPVPGFFELADQPVCVDADLHHGQLIRADKHLTMRIIHSPGHSPGSVNILFEEDKILFTADSIPLKNDIPNYDNYKQLINSLSNIRYNHQFDTLISSWAAPTTEPAAWLNLMDEGEAYLKTIDEAVREIYNRPETGHLAHCSEVVTRLNMPSFFVNPICDKAFRTHL